MAEAQTRRAQRALRAHLLTCPPGLRWRYRPVGAQLYLCLSVFIYRIQPCEASKSHFYVRPFCTLGIRNRRPVKQVHLRANRERGFYQTSNKRILAGGGVHPYNARLPLILGTWARRCSVRDHLPTLALGLPHVFVCIISRKQPCEAAEYRFHICREPWALGTCAQSVCVRVCVCLLLQIR